MLGIHLKFDKKKKKLYFHFPENDIPLKINKTFCRWIGTEYNWFMTKLYLYDCHIMKNCISGREIEAFYKCIEESTCIEDTVEIGNFTLNIIKTINGLYTIDFRQAATHILFHEFDYIGIDTKSIRHFITKHKLTASNLTYEGKEDVRITANTLESMQNFCKSMEYLFALGKLN